MRANKRGFLRNRNRKEEFPYMFKSREGYEIVKHGMEASGRLTVIGMMKFKDFNEYVVGVGYSPKDGQWNQGYYPQSYDDALDIFREHTKYREFDPRSERDLEFMRHGTFHRNYTDMTYLREHDYRDPGFDAYAHFDWDYAGFKQLPTRDEYDRFRNDIVIRNRNSGQAKSRKSVVPVFPDSDLNESVMENYCDAYDCELDTVYINDGYLFTVYDRHSPRWAVIKAVKNGNTRWNLDVWISHTRPVRRPNYSVLTGNEPDWAWRNCDPKNFLHDIMVIVYTSPGDRGDY